MERGGQASGEWRGRLGGRREGVGDRGGDGGWTPQNKIQLAAMMRDVWPSDPCLSVHKYIM